MDDKVNEILNSEKPSSGEDKIESNANKKIDYRQKAIEHTHVFNFILIGLLVVIMLCFFLAVRNFSLSRKIADYETLIEGYLSENQALNLKLEDYYGADDYDMGDTEELSLLKEDNSKLEAEIDSIKKDLENVQLENETLKNSNNSDELQEELDAIKEELKISLANEEKYKDIYSKILDFVDTDFLGTDDYNSDQYIIFTNGEEKEITITARSAKRYTTTVVGDNYGVLTEWVSPFENYQAQLKIIPKNEGTTKFHFTNSFNSDSFDVMVVYLKLE